MRNKMVYIIFLLFLLITIPYVITIFIDQGEKEEKLEKYESGYKIVDGEKIIDLEEYLLKILPGQISMDQKENTLKAQTVILRTDVIRRMGKKRKISKNQLPYPSSEDEQYKRKLGNRAYESMDQKRKKAVSETKGQVIVYKDQLIKPYFHEVSIGVTLDAREWFGKDIPYIKEKESLSDIESKDYMTVKVLSYDQIQNILKVNHKKDIKIEELKKNLKPSRTTKNGYVKEVNAGGVMVTGEAFAKWFHLSSNNFYFERYKGKVRVICLGKGSGLGLSQYGAEQLSKKGRTYKKILNYYYPNTRIKNLYE